MVLYVNRRKIMKSLTAAALSAVSAPVFLKKAQAAQPVICASLMGDDKPETKIWIRFSEIVERKLPGRFYFKIIKNSALGGEREVNEGMRLGSVQASLSTLSSLSAWVPQTQIFDMPFLFRDADHVAKAAQGRVGQEIKDRLHQQNFIALDFINYGVRHLLGKETFSHVETIEDKRIRVIQSPLHVALWKVLGALPVALPVTETYDALATGIVDAMDLTVSAYSGFRLFEVAPQVTLSGHIWASGVIMFSRSFWQSCSGEEQKILQEAGIEAAAYFNELMQDDEEKSRKLAEKNGAVFSDIEEREKWQKKAYSVWQDFADQVGGMDKIEFLSKL